MILHALSGPVGDTRKNDCKFTWCKRFESLRNGMRLLIKVHGWKRVKFWNWTLRYLWLRKLLIILAKKIKLLINKFVHWYNILEHDIFRKVVIKQEISNFKIAISGRKKQIIARAFVHDTIFVKNKSLRIF